MGFCLLIQTLLVTQQIDTIIYVKRLYHLSYTWCRHFPIRFASRLVVGITETSITDNIRSLEVFLAKFDSRQTFLAAGSLARNTFSFLHR